MNLFCGCAAIITIFSGQLELTGLFVIIALILDFLDGFLARALNVNSPLGKELDSMADMVTFAVVPGLVMYHLFQLSLSINPDIPPALYKLGKYYMFIVTIFSALRLAKFNIDERQTSYFVGLPTPGNTLFIVSLPFILMHDNTFSKFLLNPFVLIAIATIMSYLLVAEIPILSLKIKSLDVKTYFPQFLLAAITLILFITLKYSAPPLIIFTYIVLSLIFPPDKVKTT
jgi:CDP-diacylglycerol---serine O-phosphatidyltransferase